MIFRSITVENLFCYNGEQTLDLTRPAGTPADRKVALVVGRNGYGKTSLLNAVKLLFLGTEIKEQRQVGFPPMNLQRNEYILGKQGRWLGIRNRTALRNPDARFRVRITFDRDDQVVTVEREFTFDRNGKFDAEILRYRDDGGNEFAEGAAQERLDELLPFELVRFFFFDGEEIQQLAEAPDADRQAAMERLLRLRFLTGVEEQVGELSREWFRAELPEEIRAKITGYETDVLKHEAEAARIEAENRRLGMEEQQLASDMETLARRMDSLRTRGAVANTAALEKEIAVLSRDLEERQSALAPEIAADAPLLVSPGLVAAGIDSLAELIDRKAQSRQASLKDLFAAIPGRVFDEPPHPVASVPDHVKGFYKRKLDSMLAAAAVEDTGPPHLLDSLDLPRARQLHERLTTLRATWSSLRQARAQALRDVSRMNARLRQLKEELRKAEFSEPESAAEFETLLRQRDTANKRLGEIAEARKLNGVRLEKLASYVAEARRHIRQLEKQVGDAAKQQRRLDIANALRNTFYQYRAIQRQQKRQEIEELVNRHFARLMTGHRLVSNVRITDDFHMRLHAADGGAIALSTVSHGMRQLAVTALLWALKDLAQHHRIPVVVDTPLARIDRQNQHNLLQQYYPNAGDQVIMLATDSEIDDAKFSIIKPHLYRQVLLHNPTGERAEFETCSIERLMTE